MTCPDCDRDVSTSAVSCPHCGCPLAPTQAAPTRGEPPLRGARLAAAVAGGVLVVGLVVAWSLRRDPSPSPEPAPTPAGVESPAPTPHEETPADAIAKAPNVGVALAGTIGLMADTLDKSSLGSDLFLIWCLKHPLRWSDVGVVKDETNVALVLKDPAEERGKAMCASGSVAQISARHDDAGTYYEGQISTSSSYVHFRAVGSTGKLVEESPARFCGVVTGIYSFSNAANGTTHTAEMIGMFDLPENRATAAAPSSKPSTKPVTVPAPTPKPAESCEPYVTPGGVQMTRCRVPAAPKPAPPAPDAPTVHLDREVPF